MQLQPLESALRCLRCGMDVPLRYDNATVPGDSHDGEGVHTRFTEPSQHGMTKRVQDKIASEERTALNFLPLIGQFENPAKHCKLTVEGCRAH
jgi:hypothetical protein